MQEMVQVIQIGEQHLKLDKTWLHILAESTESLTLNIKGKLYEYATTPEININFKKKLKNPGLALAYLKQNSTLIDEIPITTEIEQRLSFKIEYPQEIKKGDQVKVICPLEVLLDMGFDEIRVGDIGLVKDIDILSPWKYFRNIKFRQEVGDVQVQFVAGGVAFPMSSWREYLKILPNKKTACASVLKVAPTEAHNLNFNSSLDFTENNEYIK